MPSPGLEARAEQLATAAHLGQLYGDLPYAVHLRAVVEVLQEFGVIDSVVIAAGWLHDAIEDAGLTPARIAGRLGGGAGAEMVGAIVDAVTDGEGGNRAQRKERPYRLIPGVPGALTVKLADRIANVRAAKVSQPNLLRMYRKEQEEFERRLATGGVDSDAARERRMFQALRVELGL